MRITPSLSNRCFTAGKAYEVIPNKFNPDNPRLGDVIDDRGIRRCVCLPVGRMCPHLRPPNVSGDNVMGRTLERWLADNVMGRWSVVD